MPSPQVRILRRAAGTAFRHLQESEEVYLTPYETLKKNFDVNGIWYRTVATEITLKWHMAVHSIHYNTCIQQLHHIA